MKISSMPPWGQWLSGSALLAIAIGAGTTGFLLNVSHGLETSYAQGVIYGLGDLGKIVIPLVAGVIGWNAQTKGVAIVCVILSLWCAINYYADKSGAQLLAKQNQAALTQQTESKIAELVVAVKSARELADIEAKRKKCGPECKRLQERADLLAADLEAARKQRETQAPAKTSGLAILIASSTGMSADVASQWKDVVGAALFLVAIECLVWLSIPAMALLMVAAKSRKAKPMAKPVATADVKVSAKSEVLAAMQASYNAAEELPSMRKLAERFSIPRSTFCEWMREWKQTGQLPAKPVKLRVVA